ncbi:MAG: hypothetical protein KGL48_11365 [Sphingomonadales bacterium]|nr:hypothetical protein [Sphingomonadales bacterium]
MGWTGMRERGAWSRACGVVAAAAIVTVGFGASTNALASDQTWACEVMLCASNPGGWMEFSQCVPPIEKLITHLALGGAFPVCYSGGMSSASYIKPRGGRPGYVTFHMNDGTSRYYAVPSQQDVNLAQGYPRPGGRGTLRMHVATP